eukprot:TRINITY_DN5329_c0_g1_i1.p1 TRINITY_DN5329_c0_g1~~TRINITY_DN5329_c0_g1_i1.p1  ORF type:complete len:340 (+),score=113.98 TRINITY_DN5329_c0_g1_i1:127-1146(+)
MMMKSLFAAAALMFVGVQGQTAPADTTGLVPYDGVGGGDVQWCRVSADCALFGDTEATCRDGVCECTEPQFRYLSSAWGCFPREFDNIDQVKQVILITISISFTAVDCEKFFALNPTGPADLLRVLEIVIRLLIKFHVLTCGSLNVGMQVEGTAADLIRLGTLAEDLPAELAKYPSLIDLANSPISVTLSTAQSGACAMDNANRTVVIEGRCNALLCNDGYNVTTSSAGVQLCLPDSVTKDSSDGLNDGEIAGIVLGSVALAGCIIAVISIFFMGGAQEEPVNDKNAAFQQNADMPLPKEPINEDDDHYNAPFGVADDHAQPNETGQSTDDGTEGTIVV